MDRFIIHNLFGIEGFNIAWYGVIIGFGMVLLRKPDINLI